MSRVSFDREVTPLPCMPHGVMCSNHDKSVSQFKAIPCVVIYLEACIPIAATLLSPIQTPVCGDRDASRSKISYLSVNI